MGFLVSLIRMSMPFNANLSTKSDDVKKWKENSVSEYQQAITSSKTVAFKTRLP